MEVYVCRIQIVYSLMWTFLVRVLHECSIGWVDTGFVYVRLMERLNITCRGWSPHARDDMLDALSTAELCEFGDASWCGIELVSTIRQELCLL